MLAPGNATGAIIALLLVAPMLDFISRIAADAFAEDPLIDLEGAVQLWPLRFRLHRLGASENRWRPSTLLGH